MPTPTSGAGSAHILVHGEVRDDGELVDDAEVVVSLMDDEDVEVGEVVPQREIEARVDDGRYEVVLDPDEIPSGFWDGEDYVNFDLRVVDGGRMAFWGTTAHLVDGDFWHSDSGVRVGDRVLRIDFDIGRETVRETGATSRSGLAVMDLGEASAERH